MLLKLRGKRLIVVLGVLLLAIGVLAGPAAAAALKANLNGAGATFPQPIYVTGLANFTRIPGVNINYQGVGSGAGITQFTAQTLDFGASDAFMTSTEVPPPRRPGPGPRSLQIPTVFGSITSSTTYRA